MLNRPENLSLVADNKSVSIVDAKASPVAQFEEICSVFQEGEHISHTFAYRRDLVAGKIAVLDKPYQLVIPMTTPGLVCYILIPETPGSTEIKVVFRGTKDAASVFSDLEPEAPGAVSYLKSQNTILAAINNALKVVGKKASISIYGHSLGGAYAQNCYTDLMRKINKSLPEEKEQLTVDEDNYFKNITALTIQAYNSAGVTKHVASNARTLAPFVKRKGVRLTCLWQHVAGDLVQQTGRASILSDAKHDVASVHVLKVHYEQAPEYVWRDTYNVFQAVSAFKNTVTAHTNHCHRLNAPPSRLEYYVNDKPEDEVRIHSMLARKNGLLQNNLIQWVQSGIGFIAAKKYGSVVDASEVADPFVVLQPEDLHGYAVDMPHQQPDHYEFVKNGDKPVRVSLLSVADVKSENAPLVGRAVNAAASVEKISVTNKEENAVDTRKLDSVKSAPDHVDSDSVLTLSPGSAENVSLTLEEDDDSPLAAAVFSPRPRRLRLIPIVPVFVGDRSKPMPAPNVVEVSVVPPVRPLSMLSDDDEESNGIPAFKAYDVSPTANQDEGALPVELQVPSLRLPREMTVGASMAGSSAADSPFDWAGGAGAIVAGSVALSGRKEFGNSPSKTSSIASSEFKVFSPAPAPTASTPRYFSGPAQVQESKIISRYILVGATLGFLVAVGIGLAVGTHGIALILILAGLPGFVGGTMLGALAFRVRKWCTASSTPATPQAAHSPAVVRTVAPRSSYSRMPSDVFTPAAADAPVVAPISTPKTPKPPQVSQSIFSCLEDCSVGMQAMSQAGVWPPMPTRSP